MLRHLIINNLVLIDSLSLPINKGFSIITGETGSGKSILLSALKILQGGSGRDRIKEGCDSLKVEAIFDIQPPHETLSPLLASHEIDFTDEIIIERQIFPSGKNRCRINGSLVNIGLLKEISYQLLDIYGQNEYRYLKDNANQLILLDKFGGLTGLREQFAGAYREWKLNLTSLSKLEMTLDKNREQKDYFEFQWKELDAAGLKEGEEEIIEQKIKEIMGVEQIRSSHHESMALLSDSKNSISENLNTLLTKVRLLELYSTYFKGFSDEILELKDWVETIYRRFCDYTYPATGSPAELDELNSTLARWQRLQNKFKRDMQGLIKLRDQRRQSLDSLENSDNEINKYKDQIHASFQQVETLGLELQKKRLASAKNFSRLVNSNLSHLGMEQAEFSCRFAHIAPKSSTAAGITELGFDTLTYHLTANQGHRAKPLSEVASGGETSRIMLAIKSVLAEWDDTPLLVFDEIDTGIGGITGNRVGEALKKLSLTHQVIAITHLHQVAAHADSQINVTKKSTQGQTFTTIQNLNETERVVELARMMGDNASEETLRHAQKILEEKPRSP